MAKRKMSWLKCSDGFNLGGGGVVCINFSDSWQTTMIQNFYGAYSLALTYIGAVWVGFRKVEMVQNPPAEKIWKTVATALARQTAAVDL